MSAPRLRVLALAGVLALSTLATGFLSGAELDLRVVEEATGSSTVTVAAGDLVRYRVDGELTANDSQGLASVVFDLHLSGGDLPPADLPDQPPMDHFVPPLGASLNPLGFAGTPSAGELLQVGGAQNWLGNDSWPCTGDGDCPGGSSCSGGICAPLPDLGTGELLTGVAVPGSPMTLVRGGLTAPATPGLYLLVVGNVRATAVAPGSSGDPWWGLIPAGEGSVSELQIEVTGTARGAIPALSPSGVALTVVLLAGAAGLLLRRR